MDDDSQDLEENSKHFLIFGKVIGIYPSGKSTIDKTSRIIPIILFAVGFIDLLGVFVQKPKSNQLRTAAHFSRDLASTGFYLLGAFLYFYIQRNFNQFQALCIRWRKITFYSPDLKLKQFINVTSFCILTSAILENIVFHFRVFPVFDPPSKIENGSSLEIYYKRAHGHWALYVPYSPISAIFLLITNKFALYAWNFSDILIIVLCRALRKGSKTIRKENEDDILWNEYFHMKSLLADVDSFLSPIVFACYAENFYAICMQLHMWLTPHCNQSFMHTWYAAWSFLHLFVRVWLVTNNAAKVHEEIKQFARHVRIYPGEKYRIEIERLQFSTTAGIRGHGITGLGCFLINKSFILGVLSVAFTFEIFLLQSENIILSN